MFKIIKKDNEEIAILDPEEKRNLAKKRYDYFLKNSGIPRFYWDIEFKDYKGNNSRENLEKIIYYSKSFFKPDFNFVHMYLYGNNNSQKTALACNIGKEAIRQGYEVKFILAGSLIDKLMKLQGFGYNEEIETEINKLKKVNILIIDDIFDQTKSLMWQKPDSSSLIISAWDIFLRELVSSSIKLVLTSNIPINMIEKKFGTSLFNLIDRNFVCLGFFDDVKSYKKKNFNNLFPTRD